MTQPRTTDPRTGDTGTHDTAILINENAAGRSPVHGDAKPQWERASRP